MVKQIIFDFEGTLVNSKEVLFSIFNQLSTRYGFKKLQQEEIELLKKLSIKESCSYLQLPLYWLPFIATDIYRLYKNSLNSLALFDGIKSLLKELNRRGY